VTKLTQQDLLLLEEYQRDLKDLKEKEFGLRKKIISYFRYGSKHEGVVHKSIDDSDIDICITLKLNRSLDQDAVETLWSDFSDEERECIKIVYELRVGPYKKLLNNNKVDITMLQKCVTEKPGLASIELKYDE
jgi:hypothetical protein